jgi:hypothetical protein
MRVLRSETLGQQHIHALPDDVVSRIAEEIGDPLIGVNDPTLGVCDQHSVRREFDEIRKQLAV